MVNFGPEVMTSMTRFEYKDLSHNGSKIILHISMANYALIAKIISKLIGFVFKTTMPETFKQAFLKDLRTLRSILGKSENGFIPYETE